MSKVSAIQLNSGPNIKVNLYDVKTYVEQISETDNSPFDLLLSSKLSGSPHAILLGTTLYFEVNTLLEDFAETQIYSELSKLIDIKLTPSKS